MIGISIWLLVVSSTGYREADTVTVVDRFVTAEECLRVAREIPRGARANFVPRCIQATVVKP